MIKLETGFDWLWLVVMQPLKNNENKYNSYAFDCDNPLSIDYIDKESCCQHENNPTPIQKQIHWDLLFHPNKAQYLSLIHI